jgi:hypothetical protein
LQSFGTVLQIAENIVTGGSSLPGSQMGKHPREDVTGTKGTERCLMNLNERDAANIACVKVLMGRG